MPQVGNASLHTGPRASALTSELAASCCREEKSRVTTQFAAAQVDTVHGSELPIGTALMKLNMLPGN